MAKNYDYVRSKTVKFVNPYNFISVDKKKDVRAVVSQGKNTGVLHCELITKTPLAMPDTEKVVKDENGHPTYPFMSLDGVPFIPGSSIRGVLRSVYETLTDSCFVTLDDEGGMLAARVTTHHAFNAGVLIREENDEWKLYEADRYIFDYKSAGYGINNDAIQGRYINTEKETYINGEYVKADVKMVPSTNQKGMPIKIKVCDKISKADGKTDYILYIGEEIGNKKSESVFRIKEEKKLGAEKIKKALTGLKNTQLMYQDKAINKNLKNGSHTGYKNFDAAYRKGVVPIWYMEENGYLYFSLACIGRKTYDKRVENLIGEHRAKCKSRNSLCPACRLFGMVGKGGNAAGYGSRIRITDALTVNGNYTLTSPVTLKELGSPRPGYLLFYSKGGKEYDSAGAEIKGRKYYWHIPNAANDSEIYSEKEKNERNMTCELVDRDSKFEFDIYYENLTDEELQQLVWLAALGENDVAGRYCFKFGHGKPLGLGSAKVTITSMANRTWDSDNGYTIEMKNVESYISGEMLPEGFSEKAAKELYKICDYQYWEDDNVEIRYPYVIVDDRVVANAKLSENGKAAHNWFTENKNPRKDSKDKSIPLKSLGECSNKEFYKLPAYEIVPKGFGNERHGNSNKKQCKNHGNRKRY